MPNWSTMPTPARSGGAQTRLARWLVARDDDEATGDELAQQPREIRRGDTVRKGIELPQMRVVLAAGGAPIASRPEDAHPRCRLRLHAERVVRLQAIGRRS